MTQDYKLPKVPTTQHGRLANQSLLNSDREDLKRELVRGTNSSKVNNLGKSPQSTSISLDPSIYEEQDACRVSIIATLEHGLKSMQ